MLVGGSPESLPANRRNRRAPIPTDEIASESRLGSTLQPIAAHVPAVPTVISKSYHQALVAQKSTVCAILYHCFVRADDALAARGDGTSADRPNFRPQLPSLRDGAERLPLHGSAGGMAACRGRGLRVDRPRWTRGRRPRPVQRIFAPFGLVRQWVAPRFGPCPGRAAWPVSPHAPGRQPHRRPLRHRPRRCRCRSFALRFRRGSALVLPPLHRSLLRHGLFRLDGDEHPSHLVPHPTWYIGLLSGQDHRDRARRTVFHIHNAVLRRQHIRPGSRIAYDRPRASRVTGTSLDDSESRGALTWRGPARPAHRFVTDFLRSSRPEQSEIELDGVKRFGPDLFLLFR